MTTAKFLRTEFPYMCIVRTAQRTECCICTSLCLYIYILTVRRLPYTHSVYSVYTETEEKTIREIEKVDTQSAQMTLLCVCQRFIRNF